MTLRRKAAAIAAMAATAIGGTAAAAPATSASAPARGTILLTINGNLHTIGDDGTGLRRITRGGGISDASYSPDGRRIAYSKNVAGTPTIFVMPATGGRSTRLYPGENPSWSPDGTKLAFGQDLRSRGEHIYTAPARPGARARRILAGNPDGAPGCSYFLGYRDPKWSRTGANIAVTKVCDDDHFDYSIVLARPTGGLIAGKEWPGQQASYNSTGTTLAAATWDWAFAEQEIFRVDTRGGSPTYLNGYQDYVAYSDPVWSPDNARIAARRTPDTNEGIYHLVAFRSRDGSGMRTLLRGSSTYRIVPRDWKAG